MNNNEFDKFARMHQGISSTTLNRYKSAVDACINPSIIEERKLNVAQMDVFSRLMMDRIIFLGVQIDDDVANIIIAEHSGQPFEKVAADGERNFWMTAQEALEYGMVDQILTKK